jgi:hypothetical protein
MLSLSNDREGTTQLAGEIWLASIAFIGCLLLQRKPLIHGSMHSSGSSNHSRSNSSSGSGGNNTEGSIIGTWRHMGSPLLQLTLLMTLIWYITHSWVLFDCYPRYNHISQYRWLTGTAIILSWIAISQYYPSSNNHHHHYATRSATAAAAGATPIGGRVNHGAANGGMGRSISGMILITSLLIHASLARDDVADHVTPLAMYIADMLLVAAITFICIWWIGSRDHDIAEWCAAVCCAGLQSLIYAVGSAQTRTHRLSWNATCNTFTFPAYS